MSVFSHSRIDTYETCPKKYEFAYVLKIPKGPDGIEAFTGSRVHDALEWLYDQVRLCRVPDIEDLVERFAQVWDAEWSDDVRITRTERTATIPSTRGPRWVSSSRSASTLTMAMRSSASSTGS
jgi:putative RecB family exonuclease